MYPKEAEMAEKSYDLTFEGYWRDQSTGAVPAESGVYCVYECTYDEGKDTVSLHELIYIGEAGNVNTRIATHEKRPHWEKHVKPGNELCFSFAGVREGDREEVEAALIFRHKPPENDEYKDFFPYEKTSMSLSGRVALLATHFSVV
jgi:excinuclease UvrABC nuclease subunit